MNNKLQKLPDLECTGCMSCFCSCPVDAIEMRSNTEGFLYPHIDEQICVGCGKCVEVCPEMNELLKHPLKEGEHYIAWYKNRDIRKKSASGGAFAGIATEILKNLNGVVFGAAFDDKLVVRHIAVVDYRELWRLQNSKYVQSEIGNSYKEARRYLNEGKIVFFTGTPCQIAGLYRFLGKEYDNLITADIICHGVSSPGLFERHCIENSKSWKGIVKGVRFRYKNSIFKSRSSFYMIMEMSRGPAIIKKAVYDAYYNIFLKGYGFRESCYKCKYASLDRIGDFTIGDCDSYKNYPEFHPDESNSTLMLNTQKAITMWNKRLKASFEYTELDILLEASRNKQLKAPFVRPEIRNTIYQDVFSMDWNKVSEKYCKKKRFSNVYSVVACYLPQSLIRIIRKIIR